MTRDFNKQERDDRRPSSRYSPSGRQGAERSPRPGKPRLNREMVDRGWETGARPNHADYRQRDTRGQSGRENWHRDQSSVSPSAQNGRPNRRPYDNRQDNNRNFDQSPQGNRPRSYNSGPRNFNDQRSNDSRNYSERPRGTNFNDRPRAFEQRPRSNDQNPNRPGYQRDFNRDSRTPRYAERDNRAPRNFTRNNSGPGGFQQRNNSNARWQSRPQQQNSSGYNTRTPDAKGPAPEGEQFEGDYEHFNAPQRPSKRTPPERMERQPVERHVTPLPDGRVLKGPRPVQRKNAEFWKDIADNTEKLVSPVVQASTPDIASPEAASEAETPPKEDVKPKTVAKPTTRKASVVARGRKPGTKTGTKKAVAKPRSNGPQPSRPGFKWPTSSVEKDAD